MNNFVAPHNMCTLHRFLQFDLDSAAPPEQAWRRRLNSHANLLKEFRVTFTEAIKMVSDFYFLISL